MVETTAMPDAKVQQHRDLPNIKLQVQSDTSSLHTLTDIAYLTSGRGGGEANGRAVPQPVEVSGQHEAAELIEQRIQAQRDYIETRRHKFKQHSEEAPRTLYRLNGDTKGYIEELEEVNAVLPPMSEKARVSVVIPCFNEEKNIERTLEGWINQANIEPGAMEFLLLVNRPNSSRQYDRTEEILRRLQHDPRYANLNLVVVEKTFNFPDRDLLAGENGAPTDIKKGNRMGLIYKYAADLALLRNLARKDKARIANHLMRTGGADSIGRNPDMMKNVFEAFDEETYIEQYVSRSEIPVEIYQHIPLLQVANRINELVNLQVSKGKSHIGNGTYRMALYAEAGGFDPKVRLGEEINLSRRMRKLIQVKSEERGFYGRKRSSTINALDDPRRLVATVFAGRAVTEAYSDTSWGNDAIRNMTVDDVLKTPVPPEAQLTVENLERQVNGIYRLHFRSIYNLLEDEGLDETDRIRQAKELADKYLRRAFLAVGVNHYAINYGKEGKGEFSRDIGAKDYGEIINAFSINIEDIDRLQTLVAHYPRPGRIPDWMWLNKRSEQVE